MSDVSCGSSDFLDERPLDVVLAQLARPARPLATRDGSRELVRDIGRPLERRRGGQRHDASGLFAFGVDEVLVAIDAGRRANRALRPRGQERRAPPGEAGGDGHGRHGVAEVVLAVAERPLAVLPRFAPVDGRQRDEHDVVSSRDSAPPRVAIEYASLFERMTVRRVVIDGRLVGQPGHRSAHDVGFRRVEVAAGRVDPQRPPRRLEHLPRRQPQRVPKHIADGRCARWLRRDLEPARLIKVRPAWCVPIGWHTWRRVQREDRRAREPAKGPRL